MLDTFRGYVGGREYVGGGGGGVSWGGWRGGGGSLGPRPGKTAQILLEKPFKNHRKK